MACGLILGAFYTVFQAGQDGMRLGAAFGRRPSENRRNLKYRHLEYAFCFLAQPQMHFQLGGVIWEARAAFYREHPCVELGT